MMEFRITVPHLKSITNAYQQAVKISKPAGQEPSTNPVAQDRMELSPEAKQLLDLVKTAETRARELPDVREQLVMNLRDQVNRGQYHVDAKAVAEQLLKERQ